MAGARGALPPGSEMTPKAFLHCLGSIFRAGIFAKTAIWHDSPIAAADVNCFDNPGEALFNVLSHPYLTTDFFVRTRG